MFIISIRISNVLIRQVDSGTYKGGGDESDNTL